MTVLKELHKLSPDERLELYTQALLAYTKTPKSRQHKTNRGLCYYFCFEHDVICTSLCPEWYKHVTQKVEFGYLHPIDDDKVRIEALIAMINELKLTIK